MRKEVILRTVTHSTVRFSISTIRKDGGKMWNWLTFDGKSAEKSVQFLDIFGWKTRIIFTNSYKYCLDHMWTFKGSLSPNEYFVRRPIKLNYFLLFRHRKQAETLFYCSPQKGSRIFPRSWKSTDLIFRKKIFISWHYHLNI